MKDGLYIDPPSCATKYTNSDRALGNLRYIDNFLIADDFKEAARIARLIEAQMKGAKMVEGFNDAELFLAELIIERPGEIVKKMEASPPQSFFDSPERHEISHMADELSVVRTYHIFNCILQDLAADPFGD